MIETFFCLVYYNLIFRKLSLESTPESLSEELSSDGAPRPTFDADELDHRNGEITEAINACWERNVGPDVEHKIMGILTNWIVPKPQPKPQGGVHGSLQIKLAPNVRAMNLFSDIRGFVTCGLFYDLIATETVPVLDELSFEKIPNEVDQYLKQKIGEIFAKYGLSLEEFNGLLQQYRVLRRWVKTFKRCVMIAICRYPDEFSDARICQEMPEVPDSGGFEEVSGSSGSSGEVDSN